MDSRKVELSEVITDIAAGPFGSNLKVACFVPEGFPIIDGANLKGLKITDNLTKFVTEEKARSLSRSIARRGEMVVTISGTLGQIAYIPENSAFPEYLCSQRQFRVAFDTDKVYVPFLVYYFHTRNGRSKILAFANQTGVPALSQPTKNFKRIVIDLPDIVTQKRIAKCAELMTSKIELNSRINDYLLELATSLFEGALVESSIEVAFGDIVEFEDSKRVPLNSRDREQRKGPYPYYGATSIMDYVDDYLFDGIRVLLGEDGTVIREDGRPVLQYVWGKYWVNNHAHILKASSVYPLEMIYVALSRTAINHIVTGAVQMKISQKNLKGLELEMPDPEAVKVLGDLFTAYRANVEENRSLEQLRDALLPKLMSGEIDVSQVDLMPLNNHLAA